MIHRLIFPLLSLSLLPPPLSRGAGSTAGNRIPQVTHGCWVGHRVSSAIRGCILCFHVPSCHKLHLRLLLLARGSQLDHLWAPVVQAGRAVTVRRTGVLGAFSTHNTFTPGGVSWDAAPSPAQEHMHVEHQNTPSAASPGSSSKSMPTVNNEAQQHENKKSAFFLCDD